MQSLRQNNDNKINYLLPFLYLTAIIYLLINTGIVSDDFDRLNEMRNKSFGSVFIPRGVFTYIETPVLYFTHYLWYYFADVNNTFIIVLFKIFYIFLSFYLISRFFRLYCNNETSY